MIFKSTRLCLALLVSLYSFSASALEFQSILEDDQKMAMGIWEKGAKNLATADSILKKLIKTGNYENIFIYQKSGTDYLIYADRIKKIAAIKITGDDEIDETEIMNAFGLKTGSSIDKIKVDRGIERLRELYGKNGFFNPEFNLNINQNDDQEYIINLSINENQPTKIEEVSVATPNTYLVKKLGSIIRDVEGENFSDSAIRNFEAKVSTYLRDERYLNARLLQKDARYNQQKSKAFLSYEVLNPYYFRVEIDGNERYTYADLMRAVDIRNFDRTSLNPAAEIAEKVRNYYINNGFAFAKVTFKTDSKEKDFVRFISLKVEEGQRIKIDDIDIGGRISKPAKYYRKFIFNNSSEIVDDGFYVKGDLELGYRNLVTALKNEGYLKAKILSARADFNADKNNVIINVLIDEGPLTRISEIKYAGTAAYDDKALNSLMGLNINDPLRLNKLESGLDNIINHYQNNGYIEARITTPVKDILDFNNQDAMAAIGLEIYEGPKVFVREVIIEGNNFTKDYVLLKQIEIDKGEMLTPAKLDNARKRLLALDIFSRVELRTLEHDTMTSKRALLVSVTEKNPGSFRIGFGLNNKQDLTAKGFSGITYSNLYGTARAVSLRGTLENNLANTDIRSYDISVGYLEPFLFDTTARGRIALSRQVSITGKKNAETLDGQTINKLALYTEKDFGQHVRLIWNTWSLESIKTYTVPSSTLYSQQQVATIGPTIDLDYRDNPFLPTKGHFTRFETDYSAPALGSSELIEFIRTQATFSFYTDLYKKKWIWANSIRGGYAKNLNQKDGSGIPENYAFFLGGFTTIRGYSGFDNDRIPTDNILKIDQDNLLVIPDETSYQLFKSELRFPISGALGGVLFYDAGLVKVTEKLFNDENQAMDRNFEGQSFGLGFRINTPVGPISLDYGRKINSTDEDKDHLHLSIGTF